MLERIDKLNIPQRIWYFIVGREKPNMLTQISVAIALVIWFYFFSWNLLTFLTITLMDTLDQAAAIESAFNRIGRPYQTFLHGNILTYLLINSVVQLFINAASLIGLILIWRKKRAGFLVYIFANLATWLTAVLMMGLSYVAHENSLADFVLLLAVTLYFFTGYWFFYRRKE